MSLPTPPRLVNDSHPNIVEPDFAFQPNRHIGRTGGPLLRVGELHNMASRAPSNFQGVTEPDWVLAPAVRWIIVDDGAVVFNPGNDAFVDLNESATELWELLRAVDWSSADAEAELSRRYLIGSSEAHDVVSAFLAELSSFAVVERRRAS